MDRDNQKKVKAATKEEKELLVRMRDRYELMYNADKHNLDAAEQDIKFINVPGCQWEENQKNDRKTGDRPCYEFNKIRINAKRIINHIRSNRPSGKLVGVEGDADKTMAEIRTGLIRNIYNMSDGDSLIDAAAEYQVCGGMGAWRVSTKYIDDHVFDQDIVMEPVENPHCLLHDPASKDALHRDAEDWCYSERISKDEYEKNWPNKRVASWSVERTDQNAWIDDGTVRVAEYWYKVPHEKEMIQLEDGKVIDGDTPEAASIPEEAVKRRRTVKTHKIMMIIASGESVLEGPVEWAGTMHPWVKVYGERTYVDGRYYWYGIGRFAKDAQRSYNVSRTAITETIAQAPLSTYWVTPEQTKGNQEDWARAHKHNFPFRLYNPDPQAPGAPQRTGGADVPVALIQEATIASQEIDDVTGIYSDDRGQDSASQSGRAIYARQEQGRVVTFNFPDNMAKGIKRTWEIISDLMPRIYDTERELRIIGEDGQEDYMRINQVVPVLTENGEGFETLNDMSTGRYDVVITSGPNFSTKRQEAAEIYQSLLQNNPDLMTVMGDLLFKSIDLPYSEQISERLKSLLPPEVQAAINQDQEVPPEVMAVQQQAEQALQMAEEKMAEVEAAANEVGTDKAEVEKLKANLKTEEAQFSAKVAQEMAKVAQAEAKVTAKMAESQRDELAQEQIAEIDDYRQATNFIIQEALTSSMAAIQGLAEGFNNEAKGVIVQIHDEAKKKPKIAYVKKETINGETRAVPVYEE